MAKVSKGVLGKTATSLPLLALASAAWVVLLAGLAIAENQGDRITCRCVCPSSNACLHALH